MLSFLPAFILGPLSFLLFALNTLFWCLLFYIVLLFKLPVPWKPWREGCSSLLTRIAEAWTACNMAAIHATQRIKWDVQGDTDLSKKDWYLVSANHQSWVDVVVIQRVFNRRIPFPKFFLKKELIWVPVLGGAWWALDYPFMKRRSKEYREAHPERSSEDVETARKAFQRLTRAPATVLSFLEGTRFTARKHADQESPYRHLLRPKAGGVATALTALGGKLTSLMDVTIIYPERRAQFWDLLSGRISQIVVRVRHIEIPPEFLGAETMDDPHLKERFQSWVREIWAEKDALIQRFFEEAGSARAAGPLPA
jgi:1-acyl-sn-glycerol-3-phosphate acyltransferase